ncbi:TolC family protein [Acinetobacter dispersus]|uniref:TolC family protein n=1 Tax=Acinetobacter dispersus TaxID=70348 RepID=UPI001F4A88B9|nr:TolC family protein [Acinetobacter dispersus]MCH7389027.1 TolC family protein [Acinetobacter dispersus]
MIKLKLLVLLGSLGMAPMGFALTLNQAIDAALAHENQLKFSQLSLAQGQAMLQQAKQQYGLNVNMVGQYGHEKVVTPQGVYVPTEGSRNFHGVELQFDYPLYTFGRYRTGVNAAKMQVAAREQAVFGQSSDTILQTVKVYCNVLKQQALLNLKIQMRANLKQSLFEAERRLKVGMITRADLAQVQAQYAQGIADVVSAKSNLTIAQTQFHLVTGQVAQNLTAIAHLPTIPANLENALAQVEQHPLLRQAQYEQQAAQQQYRLSKQELKPMLMLNSRAGVQDQFETLNSQSENYSVSAQLKIPLFDDGLNRANRQKALTDVNLARQKADSLRQNLQQDIHISYAQLEAIRQNKLALQEAIQSATVALQYIKKEQEVGTKTTFDELSAEQTLLDMQTQQVLNDQDKVVLVYQLLDQVGGLASTSNSK